jgi:hypothetical protein
MIRVVVLTRIDRIGGKLSDPRGGPRLKPERIPDPLGIILLMDTTLKHAVARATHLQGLYDRAAAVVVRARFRRQGGTLAVATDPARAVHLDHSDHPGHHPVRVVRLDRVDSAPGHQGVPGIRRVYLKSDDSEYA